MQRFRCAAPIINLIVFLQRFRRSAAVVFGNIIFLECKYFDFILFQYCLKIRIREGA